MKEKSRGSISEMVKPETGQANFSEKMMRSCVVVLRLVGGAAGDLIGPERLVGKLGDRQPVGDFQRRLEKSASRDLMSARTTTRSTTMSMSCFSFLSRAGASAIS